MSILTEKTRISDVLLFESAEEVNYTRDQITIVSGTAASVIGQVLGKITIGAATAAAKSGGNTGAGTLTMDASTPILAGAKVGIYVVRFVVAATNNGSFIVTDPLGRVIGEVVMAAGAGTFSATDLKFAIADGSPDFIVGDGFDITVAAGSGKWTQVAPAAVDGSALAAGVLVGGDFTATLGADATAVAVTRGPAILKTGGVTWTSGMTTPQKTTAFAQLATLGITNRQDYGV